MILAIVALLLSQTVVIKDEGATTGKPAGQLNCVGAGISCVGPTTAGGVASVTVTGGGAVGYQTVKEEGSSLPQQTTINFIGASVTCVDNPGSSRTDCTIAGGGNTGTFTATFGDGALSTYLSAAATVSASWVGSSSSITLSPKCSTTVGTNTAENCTASAISCGVTAISVGVSFTVVCSSPVNASGGYTISYSGS